MKTKINFKKALLTLFIVMLMFVQPVFSQQVQVNIDNLVSVSFYILIALVLFMFWLIFVYSEANDNLGFLVKSKLKRLFSIINSAAPLEKEKDIMMDHEYDGIHELDNVVPPWFNFLFYGSMIVGIIYFINFHVVNNTWSSKGEYDNEIQAARLHREILIKSGAFIDETTVILLADAGTIQSGKEIFTKNCVSCHGNQAGGLVGPNLTDDYWIHGGGIKNVFTTIKNGVPSKGMISWQTQLTPKQMQEVASYILSLKGTKPANPKAPEGTLYKEQADSVKTGTI